MTRRDALLLTSAALAAQPPIEDLANTFEFEAAARANLSPNLFREIQGSDRAAFDRITFRPRLMVNGLGIDLTTHLFGHAHFAPILVGPSARHARFHPDAERATASGAAAANTVVAFAADTSLPQLPPAPHYWRQADPAKPLPPGPAVHLLTAPLAWKSLESAAKSTKSPVLAKGILSPADARAAISTGAAGIVVSAWRPQSTSGLAAPLDVLPAIAEAVDNKIPILMDGGFRRGSDILKALALGARAVLIGRPVLWGLATYGARGVQQVLEQLQTELARDMVMCGILKPSEATPRHVKIHQKHL